MTEIAFHFNAPDKMAYACRFARKALRSGIQLVITGPADMLAELDGMLWNMMPQDYVAHCRIDAGEELLRFSPVVLAVDVQQGPHHEMLLNLGGVVPTTSASSLVVDGTGTTGIAVLVWNGGAGCAMGGTNTLVGVEGGANGTETGSTSGSCTTSVRVGTKRGGGLGE